MSIKSAFNMLAGILLLGAHCIADEPPVKPFVKTQLTASELAACASFKLKAGKDRRVEADKVQAILPIIPTFKMAKGIDSDADHPSFIMTPADVIDLLGKPDVIEKNGSFTYYLGEENGRGYAMGIAFHNGHASIVTTVTTK